MNMTIEFITKGITVIYLLAEEEGSYFKQIPFTQCLQKHIMNKPR